MQCIFSKSVTTVYILFGQVGDEQEILTILLPPLFLFPLFSFFFNSIKTGQ